MMGRHLGLDRRQETLLAQTIEFIHNASLLHDDLIDRSPLRRGKSAAWLKYTPEYAVLAGDYLLARVMVNLSRFGNLKLIQYTAEMISDLLEGEWIQDSLVRDWNVKLKQLDQVHELKTASLFKWCLRAPFLTLENYDEGLHQTLAEMGNLLGLLFQRGDDLLDFDVRNDEGKAALGDLKSGYLNSFGAFLSTEFTEEQKASLRACQTLAEVSGTGRARGVQPRGARVRRTQSAGDSSVRTQNQFAGRAVAADPGRGHRRSARVAQPALLSPGQVNGIRHPPPRRRRVSTPT